MAVSTEPRESPKSALPGATLSPSVLAAPNTRESRLWWVVDDEGLAVKELLGYSCAPGNPNYWWVPDLSASMCEGYHLFKTRREAVEKLRGIVTQRIEYYRQALDTLDSSV